MRLRVMLAASLALALSACVDQPSDPTRHLAPIPPATMALMRSKEMSPSDPILIRAYKKESELELWKRGRDGKYALLKTYPICRWSGQLGPKLREGDRQAPEGFYSVTPTQMNPNSSFYLAFDTGFPNAFDRAHRRTGSHLMVHGNCSSSGCFAMTDQAMAEVYAIAREAFAGGQRAFQFQSFPFRMTAANMAKHRSDRNMPFWRNLKEGYDHFEVTRQPPRVTVCGRRYAFNRTGECGKPDAVVAEAVAAKQESDDREVADLVARGAPAVSVVYEDGDQHASFREVLAAAAAEDSSNFAVLYNRPEPHLGDVSRPEALVEGPREVASEPSTGRDGPRRLAYADEVRSDAARRRPPEVVSAVDKPLVIAAVLPPNSVAAAAAAEPEPRSLYERVWTWLGGPAQPYAAPLVERIEPEPVPLPPRRSTGLAGPKTAKPPNQQRTALLP
jgi:murein L,D-transpeptidase YafK